MSVAQQAIARRRKARIDPRYSKQKRISAEKRRRLEQAKVNRQKMIASRKGLSRKS